MMAFGVRGIKAVCKIHVRQKIWLVDKHDGEDVCVSGAKDLAKDALHFSQGVGDGIRHGHAPQLRQEPRRIYGWGDALRRRLATPAR